MRHNFIKREVLSKVGNKFSKTIILIGIPFLNEMGLYECDVKFSNVKKYNTTSKGIDEFNSIECALEYVSTVCKNSTDPEFFFSKDESMRYTS